MPSLGIGTLMATLALGALAACGGASGSPTATQTTTGTTTSAGVSSAVVPLRHAPRGEATLAYAAATTTLTVEVRLTGLAPNSVHPAHIHTGLCERQGPVAYPLNNVQADGHGVADTVTAIPAITEGGIPDAAWYVNVHNGPNLTPAAQFEPIACGDVANPTRGAHVAVQLQQGPPATSPPSNPDQSASGTAQLAVRGGALTVALDVTGLRPSSSHAVHIHLGSCASQGPVIHALPSLTADAGGHATLTATVSSVSSIPTGTWYVNVHRTTAVTAGQTDFDPILCGDVGGAPGY
jgi:hypothetical protein